MPGSRTESAETAPAAGGARESEQEDDSDTAPFMVSVLVHDHERLIRVSLESYCSKSNQNESFLFLQFRSFWLGIYIEFVGAQIVVEHPDGRRCSGSLVSLRTALTSAWCAGGPGGSRELWALAPGASAARRVARVALAAGADDARLPPAWAGAAADLAVLELEAPFGGGAHSRPILMATAAAECAPGAACHVVRALGGGRAPRLRIVDAALAAGERCAARSPGWPGLRDTALCLDGPTLCEVGPRECFFIPKLVRSIAKSPDTR